MAPGWWPQQATCLHLACPVVVVPSESPLCVYLFGLEREDLIGSIDLFQKGHADQAKNESHSDQDAASAFPNMLWLRGWAGSSCGWGQSLCIGGMSQTCIPNTPGENFTTEGPLLLLLLPDLNVKEERQRPSFTHQFVHSFTPSYFIYFLSIY